MNMDNRYSFLVHPLSRELFAETDYWLKSGYYIQTIHPKQRRHFEFISQNIESLRLYYSDFYAVQLECGNEGSENREFYYIDFLKDTSNRFSRGKISFFSKDYLAPEFVIVGLFLWYLNNADYAGSITDVQKMLHHDYEELKDGFYRLFAKVSNKKILSDDELLVNNAIDRALRKFGEIGWLYFTPNTDEFEIMPSFDRLTYQIYSDEIHNFDKLFKGLSGDE
jgi:hypothetical protein